MANVNSKHPPSPGFVKVTADRRPQISAEQRSVLIRKGNQLFNAGKVEDAKRIFLTVGYSDGIIRVGDLHMKRNQPLEAFRMYWLAPDRSKTEPLIEKMAQIVQAWLHEPDSAD
ncbi:MAG: hypothetical protein EA404_13025 [Spirochaetaceae bacterium]|nr:MAG: hypothetical protein EA404_13025 [Spirochaetaceae bacterium]